MCRMLSWHTEPCHIVRLRTLRITYYLVEMRLTIENDWRPCVGKNTLPEVDYEKHVRTLAEGIRETNKVAGHKSKLS